MSEPASKLGADASAGPAASSDGRVRTLIERTLARNIPGVSIPQSETELDVGPTPKDVVHASKTARLYHYKPLVDEIYRVPVMFVMSPVARAYILDLAKGQSLIEFMLQQGYDVFLIEWVTPRQEHATLGLQEYGYDLIAECVDKVLEISGEPDLTLIGYCMGGMLSLMYNAVAVNSPVKNLACFTTPVNGDGMSLYKRWIDSDAFDIDRLADELGIIPADIINASIQALRPLQKAAGQLKLLNNVENDAFVKAHLRFDHWASNQLPVPGVLMKDLVNEFLKENRFYKGTLVINETKVDIGAVEIPFLHVAAEYDHIVPAAASSDLIDLIGSKDKHEILVKGGHVSIVAGGNALYRLWPQLDRWLGGRSI